MVQTKTVAEWIEYILNKIKNGSSGSFEVIEIAPDESTILNDSVQTLTGKLFRYGSTGILRLRVVLSADYSIGSTGLPWLVRALPIGVKFHATDTLTRLNFNMICTSGDSNGQLTKRLYAWQYSADTQGKGRYDINGSSQLIPAGTWEVDIPVIIQGDEPIE